MRLPARPFVAWTDTRICLAWLAVVAIVLALVLGLAGCSRGPSRAACKKALAAEYATAIAHGGAGPAPVEPAECKGLPGPVLEKIATEVLNGQ